MKHRSDTYSSEHREDASVDDDDRALFRAAVGPVHSLDRNRRRPYRRRPPVRPQQTEADARAVMDELLDAPPVDIETGDNLAWRRDGVQHAVLRKLRRGHYRCQAELDLHGMTVATARQMLGRFLHNAVARDQRCVRIVHGKGLRSGNRGPALKARIGGWLRKHDQVVAFCSAPAHDGGTGAVYVLLRPTGPQAK